MNDSERIAENATADEHPAKTALLIGEDHAIKAALAAILTPEGWRLDECAGLAEAMTLARTRAYELIITSRET